MLRICLLGSLEILYGDASLPLPATRKSQALLAYLLLRRRQPQPRERLAELFWGERPPEKARRSLSTALWQIHHSLPDRGFLLASPAGVQVDPQAPLELDCEVFESLVARSELASLQAAIALYRGEFLPGSYEDCILHERYRLENLYLDGLARLAAAYEGDGQLRPAVQTALRLLQLDPLQETAHRSLMRLYARLGQRSAALEQYRTCRELLRAGLQADPSPETTRLYQALLQGQLDRVEPLPGGEPPAAAPASPSPGSHPLAAGMEPPFTGREAELSLLQGAWQRLGSAGGNFFLIHGEAGLGKTRLVEELAQRLRWQSVPVLTGRCYQFERILPYQPLAEALRSLSPDLARLASDPQQAWIAGELCRLVPELAPRLPAAAPEDTSPPELEQARLFEAVSRFLALSSQPNGLLLAIEDLHWAASSTLELLHYLARSLAGAPVLLLGTLRPEELDPSHPLLAFQAQLKRQGLLQELHLPPLSLDGVHTILARLSGRAQEVQPLSQRLYQETEGNPFFLMETLKALFEERALQALGGVWSGDFRQIAAGRLSLPASLGEAVRLRASQLDEPARQALEIAAVIGREFDLDLLKDAWGASLEQTLQALDILLRRRFVEEGRGASSRDLAFTHHKIQEVIYASLPAPRRCLAHARLASLLERSFSLAGGEQAGEIAFHYQRACQLEPEYLDKAVHYLLLAGDQARLLYATREAIVYYNQALELLKPRPDYARTARIQMKLGVAYHNAFEYELAHQAYEDGFHLWQALSRTGQAQPDLPPQALRTNWPPISSIDPAYGADFAGAIAWQLFCGLVALSPDLEVIPDLAEKWQLLSGGREYLFQLKPGLRWSDGQPLTAHDFVFSARRMLAPETRSPLANLLFDLRGGRAYHAGELQDAAQVGIRAPDAQRLCMELEKPTPYFLQLLVNFVAAPQRCITAYGDRWCEPGCIVASGPFLLDSWSGGELRLLPNPAYHAARSGNIQEVRLALQPEGEDLLRRYQQGELDVLDLRFFPAALLEQAVRQHVDEYLSLPSGSLTYLGFNARQPPFQDERLRRAFVLAVDKHLLANVIQRGVVFPASGGLLPPGLPGHQPAIGLPYDPRLARQLFAQAGFTHPHRFPALEALTPLPASDPASQFLSQQWRECLGVEVSWRTVSPGLHLALDAAPPLLFLAHWHADYPDPDDFLGATQFLRWSGWRDPAYLRLLEESRSTADPARRMAAFQQADRLMMAQAPIAPLTYNRQHFLLKPWVRRYPTSALYSWFWKDALIAPH